MKEKLWFLYADSILIQWRGGAGIVDNCRNISLEVFCELFNCDEEAIKQKVKEIENQALATIHNDWSKQDTAIKLIDYELMKLGKDVWLGLYDKK